MLTKNIAKSIKNVGVEKTVEIMANALCYMAKTTNKNSDFQCDLGTISIQLKSNPDEEVISNK